MNAGGRSTGLMSSAIWPQLMAHAWQTDRKNVEPRAGIDAAALWKGDRVKHGTQSIRLRYCWFWRRPGWEERRP